VKCNNRRRKSHNFEGERNPPLPEGKRKRKKERKKRKEERRKFKEKKKRSLPKMTEEDVEEEYWQVI